uniref:Uncharacterized protein n=1 Tax=Vitis vinifera TaxID=29760 RepID=F6I514_VITVI
MCEGLRRPIKGKVHNKNKSNKLLFFLLGVAVVSSHILLLVWLLWRQVVESRSKQEVDTC